MMPSKLSSIRGFLLVALLASLAIAASGWSPTALAAGPPQGTWAWGANGSGQLGIGSYGPSPQFTPVPVNSLTGVAALAAGNYHSLALKTDGTVGAWGGNESGQLGDGTTSRRTSPVQVTGLGNAVAISAGTFHSLALKGDGSVWAWGGNSYGQLGDGTTTRRTSPVQVTSLAAVTAIVAGEYHSLALKSDGSVWAWGSNGEGQLGIGSSGGYSANPAQVKGPGGGGYLADIRALGAGWYHSLAVGSNGAVWGWGRNDHGQLGDGTTSQRTVPVQASGLAGAASASGGAFHSLALKSEGTLWAWGQNEGGQLGNGGFANSLTPVQVKSAGTTSAFLTGVVSASAGWYHNLALKSDGSVWSWGINWYGQLGDPGSSTRPVAAPLVGLAGITAVDAGGYHSLATGSAPVLAVTWANPADIVYGMPLGSAQLGASASAPGSFSYNPPAGTVLNAGSGQTLSVTFTPGDLGSYTPVSKTVQINVAKASLTIAADSKTRPFGYLNPSLTGAITGLKNGDPITASFSTAVTASSEPGGYPIVPAPVDPTGKLPNYTVTLHNGILTVEQPTYASVEELVAWFVTSPGVANALSSQLKAIQGATARGDLDAKAGATNAFANLVNAQTGKNVTPEQAEILIAAVRML